METPDPMEVARSETDVGTTIKENLDEFERLYWPIYRSRGYSKDTALLSFSMGVLAEIVTDILLLEDE